MQRGDSFLKVGSLNPGRSVFDLSYSNKFSGKMGNLYPVYLEEVVPGDMVDLGAQAVVRFAPMVAPSLHEILLHAHYFFVPYRILEDRTQNVDGQTNWERFITGGQNGASAATVPRLNYTSNPPEGSLLDFLGLSIPGVALAAGGDDDSPIIYPLYAYNMIWNEWYRHEDLEAISSLTNATIRTALWERDYLTSALPWQQRGTAPALPITGSSAAIWDYGSGGTSLAAFSGKYGGTVTGPDANGTRTILNANTVDLSSASTFNVSDLRLAVQVQRFLELNARAGVRYTELLKARFGVAPRDDRLDRPEYIGGFVQPISISEVLQTSQTGTTPQGNLAGHGLLAGAHKVGRYHVTEYGLIMGIAYMAPKTAYQQGIRRNWLRKSRYDFYAPEFANLSEQAVTMEEIYQQTTKAANLAIFGYQGRYNEMRVHNDEVHGQFRSSLSHWHLGRIFGSAPALNATFVHVDPTACTRIFADTSNDHMWVHWGNRVRAVRPLPVIGMPGRMDHSYGGM